MIEYKKIERITIVNWPLEYGTSVWGQFVEKLQDCIVMSKCNYDVAQGEFEAFKFLFQQINIQLQNLLNVGFRLILFAFSPSYMNKTRIIGYKKLWKKLKETECWISEKQIINERVFYSADKVRYAGLYEISIDTALDAIKFSSMNRSTSLLIINEKMLDDANDLLISLYSKTVPEAGDKLEYLHDIPSLIEYLVSQDSGLIYPHGNLDYGGVILEIFARKNGRIEALLS